MKYADTTFVSAIGVIEMVGSSLMFATSVGNYGPYPAQANGVLGKIDLTTGYLLESSCYQMIYVAYLAMTTNYISGSRCLIQC